jgi:hypothetical protein
VIEEPPTGRLLFVARRLIESGVPNLFRADSYCSVQTFIVFMPVSASVLVLKVPLSITVVVVVVGF